LTDTDTDNDISPHVVFVLIQPQYVLNADQFHDGTIVVIFIH